MSQELWDQWRAKWEWALDTVRKKGGAVEDLVVAPPIPQSQIDEFEQNSGLKLPEDFAKFLTHYSGGVGVGWHLGIQVDKDGEEEFVEIESPYELAELGAESESLFLGFSRVGFEGDESSESLWERLCNFRSVSSQCFNKERDPEFANWLKNCVTLYSRPDSGGNEVVIKLDVEPAEIHFVDHLYMASATQLIARGFNEFMTAWSHLGCASLDAVASFVYDTDSEVLDHTTPEAREYLEWFEKFSYDNLEE